MRRTVKLLLLSLVGAMMLVPLLISVHAGIYDSWMDNPLNGFGMWGVYIIYLKTGPSRREWITVLLGGIALRILHAAFAAERPYPGSWVINIGLYVAFLSIPILAYRSIKGPEKSRHRLSLFGVFSYSYVFAALGFYVSFARIVCQYKLDYLLYGFDGALGSHFNFSVGQIAAGSQPPRTAFELIYDSLGLFWALIFAAHINLENNRLNILKLNIANAIIGFSLYFVYPAMGPRYAFPSFPAVPQNVAAVPALLYGIPNAMPSLHVATAMLTFFLARRWKWLRWVTGIYLAMTVLAVFGTGEHYVVDAIVAIPYSLMIMAFCSTARGKIGVMAAGAGMLAIWLLVLRFGMVNPWTAWGLVSTTMALGFLIERRFAPSLLGQPMDASWNPIPVG